MSNIRSCGAPKPFDKLICDPCVCDGYGDVQIVAKNAIRTIRALELMENDVKVVKTEPLLKLLKGEKRWVINGQ